MFPTHSFHKFFGLLVAAFFSCMLSRAQVPGQWTFMKGSDTLDFIGNYGVRGLPDTTNMPPSAYEAVEWTDAYGNFWLYGGEFSQKIGSDLWKFSPNSNTWTWINGHNKLEQKPVYGTRTVPDTNNTPGERAVCYSWADKTGSLWLYGGLGYYDTGTATFGYSDLWKYYIAANVWTWLKGDTSFATTYHYGTKYVEDTANKPPANIEIGVCWTDKTNNLWLLDNKGCMWRYKIATNNWTWMSGDTTTFTPPAVYGTKGLPDSANTPGHSVLDYTVG